MKKTSKTLALAATLLLTVGLAGADIVTLDDSELSGLGGIWGTSATVDDVAGDGVEFTVTLGSRDDDDPHWASIGAEEWDGDGLVDWSSYDGFGLNFEITSSSAPVEVRLFTNMGGTDRPGQFVSLSNGETASLTLNFGDSWAVDDVNVYAFQVQTPDVEDTIAQTVTIKAMQIPEPATMSLLALGGLGALLRRRRA